MKTYLCLLAVSICVAACNSNSGTNVRSTSPAPPVMNVNTSAPITNAPPSPQTTGAATPATAVVDDKKPISTSLPVQENKSAKLMLNPAHGLPGHRCDLAVGAALNSVPAAKPVAGTQPVAAATTPAPVVTTSPVAAPTAQPAGVKPKLNPAHGLPFHDCAIEVGKPLKN